MTAGKPLAKTVVFTLNISNGGDSGSIATPDDSAILLFIYFPTIKLKSRSFPSFHLMPVNPL